MSEAAAPTDTTDPLGVAHAAVLDSIFDEAAFGVALLDSEMRFVRVNEVLAEINGVPVADHAGRKVTDVTPGASPEVIDACRSVLEDGEAVRGLLVSGPVGDALGERVFECSYHPVREAGQVTGVWSAVREVTHDRRIAAAEEGLTDQLAEERRILEEVVARTPGALALLWGRDLRIRAFNEQILENAPDRGNLLHRPVVEAFPELAALAGDVPEAVIARGESLHFDDVALPFGGAGAIDGERFYTFAVVPVPGADGTPAGALVVGNDTTASVRARLELEHELEQEHRIATELQVSLMPDRLPAVPGTDIAAAFHPADRHEIGGDFFDVFSLDDDCWMVVIGDVCGKGAEAASLTALARYTLRAAAIHEGAEPARLLERLNEAVLRQRDDMRFLTCVCAFLENVEGGCLRLTVCSAGHPPPLRVDTRGAVTEVASGGGLLGAWEAPRLTEEVIELEPGDRLVLYTDGVTEAGAPQRDLAEEGLATLLAALPQGSAAETVSAIEANVFAGIEGASRDDVAMLVVRSDPERGR